MPDWIEQLVVVLLAVALLASLVGIYTVREMVRQGKWRR